MSSPNRLRARSGRWSPRSSGPEVSAGGGLTRGGEQSRKSERRVGTPRAVPRQPTPRARRLPPWDA
eukprot:6141544-Prymnesium_polylepis.1